MTREDQILTLLTENTRITTETACKVDRVAADVATLKELPDRVTSLEMRATLDVDSAEQAQRTAAASTERTDRYRLFRWGAVITLLGQLKLGAALSELWRWAQQWMSASHTRTLLALALLLLSAGVKAQFVSDTFADTAGTDITAHIGAIGATWTKNTVLSDATGDAVISNANRLRSNGPANKQALYTASGAPVSADYVVESDLYIADQTITNYTGIAARYASGSTDGYEWLWQPGTGFQLWRHNHLASPFYNQLGSTVNPSVTTGATYHLKLRVSGASVLAEVRRNSDSLWLTSGAGWQAIETVAIMQTGLSGNDLISAANYAAVYVQGAATNANGAHLANFTARNPYTISGSLSGTNGIANTLTLSYSGTLGAGVTVTVTVASGAATLNGGSFTSASVTIPGGANPSQTFTVQSPSSGSSTLTFASASLADILPQSYASATGLSPVSVTDSHLYWSPYNWYSGTSGTMQTNNVMSGATYALSNNCGAYFKFAVSCTTGTGEVAINFDTSMMGAITSGSTPVVEYSIDGGQWASTQLTYNASPPSLVILSSALSAATHTVAVMFKSVDQSSQSAMGDRWNTPAACVKVTNVLIDGASSMAMPTVYANNTLLYWDSQGEGAQDVSASLTVTGQDPAESASALIPTALNSEVGVVAFSYQGNTAAGSGNVPVLGSSWSNYYSGASRLYTSGGASGGTVFYPAPTYVFDVEGTNDRGASSGAVQADIDTLIGSLRSAAPNAWIFEVVCPYGPYVRTPKTAAVAAYLAANPAETKVKLIDIGTTFDPYFNTSGLWMQGATLHPTAWGHGQFAALVTQAIQAALAPPTGRGRKIN